MSTSGASVSLQVRVQWKSLKKSNRYDLLAAKAHGGQAERYTNEDKRDPRVSGEATTISTTVVKGQIMAKR